MARGYRRPYYWGDGSGSVSDKKTSYFGTLEIPTNAKPNPPQKPRPIEAPSDLQVTAFETHHLHLGWTNNPVYPTSKYGKILLRVDEQGIGPLQWDLDGGRTSVVWGPVEPGRKLVISVKGGYSYTWGYQYTSWTTITWKSPSDIGEPIMGWHGWFAINPGITSFNIGADVTAIWSGTTHLDLFVVDKDGCVRTTWWDAGVGWDKAWWCVAEWTGAQPGAHVAAVWDSNFAHPSLFVVGKNGYVYTTEFDRRAAKPWFDKWYVLGVRRFTPKTSVTAMWDERENELQVYATDENGAVYMEHHFKDAGGWQGWWDIHTEVSMEPGAYVTAARRGGVNHIFAIDSFEQIKYSHGTKEDDWSAWDTLMGFDGKDFNPGGRINVQWVRDHGEQSFYIVATDKYGVVWHTIWDGDKNHWQRNWVQVAGGFAPGTDAIMEVYRGGERIDLWGVGTDWRMYWRHNSAATTWSNYNVARGLGQMPADGRFTPLFSQNADPGANHVDLFIVGTDGNVWSTWFENGYYE